MSHYNNYVCLIIFLLPISLVAQPYPTGGTQCGTHGSGGCYSLIVQVAETPALVGDLQLFPNPSAGEVQGRFTAAFSGPGSLRLTDAAGRSVWQQAVSVQSGENWFSLDVGLLPAGTYDMRLAYGGVMVKSRRLVVE